MSQLDFRREIVNTYLRKYGKDRVGLDRPSKSLSSSDSRGYDNIKNDRLSHLVTFIQDKKKETMWSAWL